MVFALDSIVVAGVPPVPTICAIPSPQAAKSSSCVTATLGLWNGAPRCHGFGLPVLDYPEKDVSLTVSEKWAL